MKQRTLGKTGIKVSEIGLGTWQVGGRWGDTFDDALADRILDEAIGKGVTFIDTADVYSSGLSEKAVGRALKRHPGTFSFATKLSTTVMSSRICARAGPYSSTISTKCRPGR